ncbi:diguanylate cyclase domain-containing protein [Halomonas sp. BC2]|uniref:diguanylate cyclase domain-containing protein n=1 Tax=Halomonas sp. BC2 TaxID=1670449 RepID=UPI0040696679
MSAAPPGDPKRRPRYITWLSLGLMSFMGLMVLIVYESRWVYPEIQAYFSQTGSLTGQQLATRARGYVQSAQESLLVATSPLEISEANHALDLAYGLFDVSMYRQHYSCTVPSLALIEEIAEHLEQQQIEPIDAAHALFIVVDCLTRIEMDQLDQRGSVINDFSESTRRHNQVLTYSSLLIFVLGLAFWVMHERQLRQTEHATAEKLAWMARAMRDPLTGIGNRSALHQDVVSRDGESLGLILIDIDFFKQYNDALGHPQGDRLLRQLASMIEQALGPTAQLYRLGGDEFAALLPCPSNSVLAQQCEALQAALDAAGYPHPAHPDKKRVTLSVGATRFASTATAFTGAYEAADKALYQVKTAGRDGWQITVSA